MNTFLFDLPADASALVLTPSDRARRACIAQWQQHTLTATQARAMPRFATLRGWMMELWREGQLFGLIDDPRLLLSSSVESALWRHVAQTASDCMSAESAALGRLLEEAWQLEHGYGDSLVSTQVVHAPLAISSNGELYRTARQQFVAHITRHRVLTSAQLPRVLAAHAGALASLVPVHLVRTPGFAPIPMEEACLLALSSAAGAAIAYCPIRLEAENVTASVQRHLSRDPADEQRAAIAWARDELAQISSDASMMPRLPLAIVVPDLQRTRDSWQRVMIEADLTFNLSLGLPLSAHPWVGVYLQLLSSLWATGPTENIAQALRHPRWTLLAGMRSALNKTEFKTLEQGVHELTCTAFLQRAGAELAQSLDALIHQSNGTRFRRDWRQMFAQIATLLGGDASRSDSQRFQLQQAFSATLDEWCALDALLPQVVASTAIAELRAMADSQPFQAEGSDAPLQVIGLLESAGVAFSSMWVTGLTDAVLPEAARPNPFLSTAWQNEARVGLASIDECASRAGRIFSGWQLACASLVVSSPKHVDGEPTVESPLIRALPVTAVLIPVIRPDVQIDRLADEQSTRVGEYASFRAGHLESQALCPRQGLAKVRLRLESWPQRSDGFPPRERGNCVHWIAQQLGQARMAGQSTEALKTALPGYVRTALDNARLTLPEVSSLVWQTESVRLIRLFNQFLNHEDSRTPFRVIAVEESVETELAGLRFRLRIDRIEMDAANEGRVFILDFKSGHVSRSHLTGDRLAAPQLPLYAHAIAQDATPEKPVHVAALAFVAINDDHDKCYEGIGDVGTDFDVSSARSKQPPFAELSLRFPQQLETLATELRDGIATVAPLKGDATCGNCGMQRFCRIDALALEEMDDADDASWSAS